ncbi:DUF5011 domain-containing protein [Listeria weihenstephanensis]|uniref:DUF5011 domain-containing protein n=1 Tax=Listeria weihenstephanensis TaxID=1006155 RepID=A0A841Z9F8_9LIST|nr:immunoglobulin-like domain-containing protein [Listeria weihenstephanensis]MBC1500953.1 DUF5011 domain-containing protein [Listeria weihenstephanensis]
MIKKIGIATTALVMCASLPLQTYVHAAKNPQAYSVKTENRLKALQASKGTNNTLLDVTDYFSLVPETDSSISKNEVTITPEESWQRGGLWSDENHKVDLTKNFHLSAELFMGNSPESADGIAFVLQNDPRGKNALGTSGGALGIYGSDYIENALAVELDSYSNPGGYDEDVSDKNHLAITVPTVIGAKHNALSELDGEIFADGQYHPVSFDWNAATKTLSYSYGKYTGSYVVNDLQATFGGTEVLFGFTGSTGVLPTLQKLKINGLQINGISPQVKVKISNEKGNDGGKAKPGETIRVEDTISNATTDATAFAMQYGVDLDSYFNINTISNIALTRNDGEKYSVTRDQLLNHKVMLPFDNASNTFTLTYDVTVNASAAPEGTVMGINSVGKVNGIKYTSNGSIELVIPDASPVITASDKTVKRGNVLDLKAGVTASDVEDGDITNKITIIENDVDFDKSGTYNVTYSVTDSDDNTTTKTITVTVTSNDAPVITAQDKSVKRGKTFSPLAGVSANDSEDGDLTSKVEVTANNVDTNKVGTYHVSYSVTDSDGNKTTKTITVMVTSNNAPVIEASDIVQYIHNIYDVKKGVTASDTEDGDLTSKIIVTANDVNTEKAGVYHVTYSVADSDGNTTTKTIKVTNLTNDAPVIATSDVYLKAGDTFNPPDGITASDLEDGDLTASIKVVSNNVNMKSEGQYTVVYSVTDSDDNTTTVTRHIFVRTNDKPEIHVANQTFKAGFAFDPMAIVSASDLEDGDVTKDIKITSNDVNPDVAGTYAITYSVTDSDDNTTTKTITVTVLTNEKPVITASDRTVKAHLDFDPMTGVSASDLEDGNMSDNIKIIANDVSIDVPGEYSITYSILDSDGNTTEKTITITVLSNDTPVITGQDSSFKAGRTFDPMTGITANDTEDGDITANIEIVSNDVNPDIAGVYYITYSITDSDGNKTEQTYTVTALTNEKPVIHASDITLAFGKAFDPMTGITAEDLEDRDITGNIQVISNDVNPNVAGIYHVTYSVTDSDGNETEVTIMVLVGAQPIVPVAPIIQVKPVTSVAPVEMKKTKALPKTGDTDSASTILFGSLLTSLGVLFLRRKR